PMAELTCDPVPGVPKTSRRLLAGYLIHRDDPDALSVVYCELQAPVGPRASLVIYENEACSSPIMEIPIFESSVCCDVVGINCSCFVVEGHHFASQSSSERKLWLRALSNLKVKLQNKAPEPTQNELLHFRSAIRENIQTLQATQESRIARNPLLRLLDKPRACEKKRCTATELKGSLWSSEQTCSDFSGHRERCQPVGYPKS
ncbi:unnamed protein product, partial [Durusdinium trenchii]